MPWHCFTEYGPPEIVDALIVKGRFVIDNNKNRMKDRPKSNPELREMKPKENSDLGIVQGQKIGLHHSGHEKSMGDEK